MSSDNWCNRFHHEQGSGDALGNEPKIGTLSEVENVTVSKAVIHSPERHQQRQ